MATNVDSNGLENVGGAGAWHARRREGIGGSDVMAMLGMSQYKTTADLVLEKRGILKPEPAGHFADRGTVMEPVIRLWVEQELKHRGWTVSGAREFLRHPLWPHVRFQGNLDGLVHAGKSTGILEIKTAGGRKGKTFQDEGPPLEYILQIQTYLCVTQLKWAVCAAGIGPADGSSPQSVHFNGRNFHLPQSFWHHHEVSLHVFGIKAHTPTHELLQLLARDFWALVDSSQEPWRVWPRKDELFDALRSSPPVQPLLSSFLLTPQIWLQGAALGAIELQSKL